MIKKYVFIAALASVTITGCGNTGEKKNNSSNEPETAIALTVSDPQSKGSTIKMTKASFIANVMDYEANPQEWNYKGDRPCIIDFYADWCGPCKIAAPILEELAAEYKDQIYIYKVDTETERELSSVFGIRSIPAFLFVPQTGRPTMSNGIARTPGETKEMFKRMIDELLLGAKTSES